ncbi:MAG: hypothetical protein IPH11_10630 [Ignavibacteriales bacterium]|nr:hypothetical protein [Ignavibacteriales bacterium]
MKRCEYFIEALVSDCNAFSSLTSLFVSTNLLDACNNLTSSFGHLL